MDTLYMGKTLGHSWTVGQLLEKDEGRKYYIGCKHPMNEENSQEVYPGSIGRLTPKCDSNNAYIAAGHILEVKFPLKDSVLGAVRFGEYCVNDTIASGFYLEWKKQNNTSVLPIDFFEVMQTAESMVIVGHLFDTSGEIKRQKAAWLLEQNDGHSHTGVCSHCFRLNHIAAKTMHCAHCGWEIEYPRDMDAGTLIKETKLDRNIVARAQMAGFEIVEQLACLTDDALRAIDGLTETEKEVLVTFVRQFPCSYIAASKYLPVQKCEVLCMKKVSFSNKKSFYYEVLDFSPHSEHSNRAMFYLQDGLDVLDMSNRVCYWAPLPRIYSKEVQTS